MTVPSLAQALHVVTLTHETFNLSFRNHPSPGKPQRAVSHARMAMCFFYNERQKSQATRLRNFPSAHADIYMPQEQHEEPLWATT